MKTNFIILLAVVFLAVVADMPEAAGTPPEESISTVSDFQFVNVPGGCFVRKGGQQVCVSEFRIGKFEVTQGQWEKVTGSNPSNFLPCGADCPVENVSWNDVQDFIESLNARSGMNYRLPTEAEWEYACRGGRNDEYCGSNQIDDVAWYLHNAGKTTHKKGTKQPNGLGLFDMSGNVWEWCSDWFGAYPPGKLQDYQGPDSGTLRVIRGGGLDFTANYARAANRSWSDPGSRYYSIGFRLILPAVRGAGASTPGEQRRQGEQRGQPPK